MLVTSYLACNIKQKQHIFIQTGLQGLSNKRTNGLNNNAAQLKIWICVNVKACSSASTDQLLHVSQRTNKLHDPIDM